MTVKKGPKILLFIGLVAASVYGVLKARDSGVIPSAAQGKTQVPKADGGLVKAEVLRHNDNVAVLPLPTNKAVQPCVDGNTSNCINGPVVEIEHWAWNANGGLDFAVGGAKDDKGIQTSKGSLMEKYGVNVHVQRQDNNTTMQQDLVDTATRLKSDPNASGIKFVTNMGDGDGQFFKDLSKLCPTCNFEVVGGLGYSRGEDGFWGPAEWKADPQKARGGLIIGVIRDGDWNIAMQWAEQFGIPNNPNDKIYDPNALNWVNADSFTKAAEMMVQGYCADLPVKGKIGGGNVHKCADAVVTWTPGDVTLAKQKGGLVPILTTRQNIFQMPCVLIGIKEWNESHPTEVKKILAASFEGADQVRVNPAALQRMGEIAAALYKEQDAAYWVRYFKGTTEPDAKGVTVQLGGSALSNLADNLQLFGLNGGPNLYAATYNTFSKYVVQQYPKFYPDVPPVTKIYTTRYIQAVKEMNTLRTDNAEDFTVKNTAAPMKSIDGRRDYAIQFASGSATILPASYVVLDQLSDQIMLTKFVVALHGHTDAAKWTGFTPEQSAEKNMELSRVRAEAVQAYLRKKGVSNVIRPYPHGQEEPKADNATEPGRAQNRRVQVVLGSL